MTPRWRVFLIDGPARLMDPFFSEDGIYLPTRWDRYVPRWLTVPWWLLKTYLVLAGAFGVLMYLLHRAGLPSLWPT
jgi:hypothetical protein